MRARVSLRVGVCLSKIIVCSHNKVPPLMAHAVRSSIASARRAVGSHDPHTQAGRDTPRFATLAPSGDASLRCVLCVVLRCCSRMCLPPGAVQPRVTVATLASTTRSPFQAVTPCSQLYCVKKEFSSYAVDVSYCVEKEFGAAASELRMFRQSQRKPLSQEKKLRNAAHRTAALTGRIPSMNSRLDRKYIEHTRRTVDRSVSTCSALSPSKLRPAGASWPSYYSHSLTQSQKLRACLSSHGWLPSTFQSRSARCAAGRPLRSLIAYTCSMYSQMGDPSTIFAIMSSMHSSPACRATPSA